MKRTLALLLSLTLVLLPLLSCAEKTSTQGGETSAAPTDAAEQATTTAENYVEERIPDGLPEENYNGYEFRVCSRALDFNVHWFARDIGSEGETGEPINDAVYLRNKTIEERFNVKIVNVPQKDPTAFASKNIKAGIDAFDVYSSHLNFGVQEGMLYDLKTFPRIDLSKPWWDQNAQKQLSINNKLYSTVSDLIIVDKDATWVLMFNKKLIKDMALPDPYALVNSGKWTMDAMYDMMKGASKDLDGDGKMTPADQYGLVSQYANARAFYLGAGENLARKDENDLPYFSMYNERTMSIIDKILLLQTDKNLTINADDWIKDYPNDGVWDKMQLVVFNTDRSLFYYAGLNRVTLLRTMDTDFGILPPPKFDEAQDKYYVCLQMWCSSCVAVPVTVSDTERTGTILEALTAESRYRLIPAYYDITLKGKFARDVESKEMLDLIFANRVFDMGDLYNWGGSCTLLDNISKSSTNTFTSVIEKNQAKIEKEIAKTVDKVKALG